MMSFTDGPAAGQTLALRRAPALLRVVIGPRGAVDALDQPDDTVKPGETIHVYRWVNKPAMIHYRCSGKGGKAASGFWPSGNYILFDEHIDEAKLIVNELWAAWCEANKSRLVERFAEAWGKVIWELA